MSESIELILEQLDELEEKDKEIERLNKENNDLRKLYQRTYKHLFDIGNDELARYFQAQIDKCPTFYVEPIIDYYEETKRLNNIINKAIEFVNSMEYCGQEDYFYDLKANDVCGNDNTFNDSKNKLLDILKGSDKE